MFNNNLLRKNRLLTLQMIVNVSVKQKHQFIRNPLTIASKEILDKEIKILPNTSRYVGNLKNSSDIYYVRSKRNAKIAYYYKCVLTL